MTCTGFIPVVCDNSMGENGRALNDVVTLDTGACYVRLFLNFLPCVFYVLGRIHSTSNYSFPIN